ncbi:MAG: hypothetical protein HYZ90_04285, partial [Candidatus Omnitrophica bacterium]|nr:hypothetical protein [Candidatus Omnitrophota bacterium]
TADQVHHPVVREALRLLKIDRGIEIVSVADVPANVGLGTSSSFTVGLLNALYAFKAKNPSPRVLAQEALAIERVILKESGGLQDQYIAAYGGLASIDVNTEGRVMVNPLKIDPHLVAELENRLLYFYTNLTRNASEIQAQHVDSIVRGNGEVIESLHEIKRIGTETKDALLSGDLDRFGRLLGEHWDYKKRLNGNISNSAINRWYEAALKAGALGGKLVGAGGGGFLMLYCPPEAKNRIRLESEKEGLKEINFRFESSGSRILLNI